MSTGIQKLATAFRSAASENRAALIVFLAAGDPGPASTVALASAAVAAGADVIELGIPFSDPLADGPVIQGAYTRALASGARVRDALESVRQVNELGKPVVLMTALNPVLAQGIEEFCRDAAAAGAAGLLVPDLPVEDAAGLRAAAAKHRLATVFLVAPDSPAQRLAAAAEAATGFLYLVSRRGVTGLEQGPGGELKHEVARARAVSRVPIAVGFGVGTGRDAARVAEHADGVIAGSVLVAAAAEAHAAAVQSGNGEAAATAAAAAAVGELVKELRAGCAAGTGADAAGLGVAAGTEPATAAAVHTKAAPRATASRRTGGHRLRDASETERRGDS